MTEPWEYLVSQITAAMAQQQPPPATTRRPTPTPAPTGRGVGSPAATNPMQTVCVCVSQLDDKRAKSTTRTSARGGARVAQRSHTLSHRWLRKAQAALAAEDRGKRGAVAAKPLRWLIAVPLVMPTTHRCDG